MRPGRAGIVGPAGRLAGALAMVAALMLGSNAPDATAAEPPDPPILEEVTVLPPAAVSYTFAKGGTKPVDGLRMNVYRDGRFRVAVNTPTGNVTDAKVTTIQLPAVFEPNTRYCIGLLAYVGTGNNASSTFSQESERLCFTMPPQEVSRPAPEPAPSPTKPDLMVTRVSGPTQAFDGTTAVYEIVLANDGTAADGTAQITLNAVDGLDPVEMAETPDGFTCEPHPLGGFSCTGSLGGVEDPIQTRVAIFKLQVRGNGSGAASVYGIANHDGALDEMTGDNNVMLRSVTVE